MPVNITRSSIFRIISRLHFLKFFLLLICVKLFAANENLPELYLIDELSREAPEDIIILQELAEDHLAINFQDLQVLLLIPGIYRQDVELLQNIINKQEVYSDKELLTAGFPEEKLLLIKPYISYEKPPPQKLNLRAENSWQDTIFKTNRIRFRYESYSASAGFIWDRDNKENLENSFLSAWYLYDKEPLRIIIGNYRLSWGLGITAAPAFSRYFSRSGTGTVSRMRQFLRPYTSSGETGFLQGCAVQYKYKKSQLSCWFSKVFYKKSHITAGSAFRTGLSNLDCGISLQQVDYDSTISEQPEHKRITALSLYNSWHLSHLSLQAEAAFVMGECGYAASLQYGASPFRNALFFRCYDDELPLLEGNPLSRSSNFAGEKGLYYGLTWKISPKTKADFYTDIWDNNRLSSSNDLPAAGSEQMLNIEHTHKEQNFLVFLRHRLAEKQIALSDSSQLLPVRLWQGKLTWNTTIKSFKFRSEINYRSELISEVNSQKHSAAAFQQIQWNVNHWQLWLRLTSFHCQIPLYLYENDIQGLSPQVCLTGEGLRIAQMSGFSFRYISIQVKVFYQSPPTKKYGCSLLLKTKL